MGKKSLTKSTTKKKTTTTAKKKTTKKTTAAASGNEAKTTETAAKSKPKKPSVKSLRKKQFDAWSPEKLFVPEPDPAAENAFSAPPVTGDYEKDQAKTIRALLLWDINEPSPVTKAKPPEPEAEKPQEPAAEKPEPPKEKPPEPEAKAESKKPDQSKEEEKPADAEAGAEAKTEPKAEKTPEPEEKPAPSAQPTPEKKPEKAEKEQKPGAAAGPEKSEKAKPPEKPASQKESDDGAAGPPGGPPEPPEPPVAEKKEPPLDPKLIGLIAIVGLLFLLIIGASFNNMGNYYLKQTHTALEIWKGRFSPRGKEKILTLPGQQAPEKEKKVYSKEEALTPAFEYYMDRADALSEAEDLIDFQAIRENLKKAKKYAATDKQKQRVKQRLETMDFLTLLYKADVAAEKQTLQSLENALNLLEQAAALDISEQARRVIDDRMAAVRDAAGALEEKAAAEEAAKAEKAAKAETTSKAKQAGKDQQQNAQPAPEPNGDAAETPDKKADKNSDKQSGKQSDGPGARPESEPH